jgi:hypothetical protein
MKPSIHFNRGVLAATLVMVLATLANSQVLREEVRAAALSWLLNDCSLQSSLRDDLRAAASPALEAFFLEALQKGPEPAQLSGIEQAAARRYEQRQQALKSPSTHGLSSQDIEDARKVSRDDFIAQEKKDFEVRFRSQAVAGLALTGGTKAKTELQQLAKDEKSPLRTSAQQALAELQRKK